MTLGAAAAGALLVAGLAGPADARTTGGGLDTAALRTSLDAVHTAGMPGIYAQVRDGGETWNAASGVADVRTKRPVKPYMQHRVGSVTKAFTSAALIQQVEKGRLNLDAPIGKYLPKLVTGQRGETITVRMLLNHTSGIGDYAMAAFPSLAKGSGADLVRYRFRTIAPTTLARFGLAAAPTGTPGQKWSYSNTNYVIAGLLLRKLTGEDPERYITANVIRRAGLRHTYFPRGPYILGPHSRAYESLYGVFDPPKDFSVYNMSWASTAGSLVSTMDDLDRFYRALLGGRIVDRAGLAQMQRTVPTTSANLKYGLGIYSLSLPCGVFWGHDGAVFGQGTQVLSTPDGRRQVSLGYNLMKYQKLDANGVPQPSPIDTAMSDFLLKAACGDQAAAKSARTDTPLFPRTG
jgi:D-alanyl-D-alanine carboxypeptidase